MTSEEKNKTGSDVSDVTSGALADAIIVWLDACASKGLEPRLSAKTSEVKLLAGPNSWVIACTPESMKAAMGAFKSDARFQRRGVKRNGYTSCMYLLSHPKDVPYVANGHTRTNGKAQSEGNTQTVVLGSVAKAEKHVEVCGVKVRKAQEVLIEAENALIEARAKLEDAQAAEEVRKLEADKAKAAKLEADKAAAIANRAKLEAKIKKMLDQAAKLEALLAA